ncbi:hypothetical protein PTNB85_10584 [Pyrenophora teres f. teres]|nr:hypothetical protein PTNB85_10584 [Pyrenophora teres f. teres]
MKEKTMNPPRKNELEPQEMGQIWAWNHKIPGVTNKCIHDLFAEQVLAQPNAPAICAWDGEMSYSVLDGLSTKLAGYLVKIGVKPGDVVPLCFEKSMWTVVAMLAVLKAGGAFAPLDPDHPVSRHKEILRQTGARMVVVSAQHSARWASSSCHVVTLSEASIGQLTVEDDLPGFSATPGNAAYVLFTSGSTGIPKGVVLEHRAVSTSCLGHGRAFGITDQSRVLQFTSYTFDFCMAEIITTLLYGGCICVPSDRDRHSDLAKAINTMGANWALLTPSVAQLLNPSDVPTLKILVIGGEQVTSKDWNRWPTSVQLINGYGPTECCIVCTGYTTTQAFKTGTIGTAIASVSWVVDPEDYHKLAPLGSVGELLVEGPILARGYLNDAEKTAAAFIEDPAWLVDGCQGYAGRRGRLYKTGDLVRYDDEGNLVCLGRKDSQVKVRGQRVELGEIEHHIQGCMPEANQIAVEVILLEGEKSNTILAAFLQLDVKTGRAFPTNKAAETGSLAQVIFPVEAGKKLAERLPSYMVPDVYFVVTQLPITVSGKTDRKRLREIGASFSAQQLAEIRTSGQGLKRQPSTENEKALQQLWAGVLAIDADSIGLDDSFFRLGGDSIAAMKLVGEARRAGIHLTVADLFRNPKLEAVASLNLSLGNSSPENIVAFALLGETSDVTQIREEVAASCNTNTSLIEDIYPCSPLQEGMMALASKRPGDYIMQSVLALHDDTDEDRFRAAWERVVQSTAVLRTRIVHSSKMGMLQVVLADGIEWEQANELEQYLEKDKSVSMGLGDSLARYALVRDVGTGKRWMVWTLHHALYDGWSLPQIANLVTEVYHGAEVGKQPGFNAFIKYLGEQDHEAAAAYWQGTLADCQAISFPALPPAVQQPVADATTAFQCPALARRPSDITMSTLIRAAWALLASSYTSSDDVVFGATVTGRNAPVAGIEAMAGPTIATVPVRVRVQHSHKVSEFLHSVQQQATEMIPYEQTGLHETAKVSADARHACSFQTLLIVQPGSNGDIAHDALGEWRSHSDLQDFTTYALMVQCVLADDEVQIIASFDRRAIEPWQVDKMLRQFSFVMQQLATADAEAGIASIDTLTPEDRQQLWEPGQGTTRRAGDLRLGRDMTYGELDVLSGRLAGHLVELGVGPEDIVPLCFEKSMWTVVAMLAVLKAGGAFLLLDPSLPHERLRLMCRKVSAKLSLASEASAPLAKDFGWYCCDRQRRLRSSTRSSCFANHERAAHTHSYIDEPDKTASTFIEAPAWRASLGLSAGQQRLYKTGDLARYKDDGSIELIGRKDNQVKLRGQRIEVEEIEHQARLAEADVAEIAVELIQPKDGEDGMLACFIVVEDSASNEDELSGKRTRLDTRTQRTIGKIQDRLERFLPQYMVPAVFIPILTLPVTWSKKIDRKRLREVGSTFSGRELAELQATTQGLKRQPSTENEKALQQLWAGVLAIDADSIGLDDSFFRLGGDSIAAMKLVGEARRAGIHLTVADLFRNPKLEAVASLNLSLGNSSPENIVAFALLGETSDVTQIREEVAASCNTNTSLIEDIYPCSPLQEGMMALASKRPGDYIMQSVLALHDDTDEDRFRAAWERVVQSTAVLRTRIVHSSKMGMLQVYLEKDKSVSMGLGDSLARYALVRDVGTGKRWMVWTLHHALYDGWSLPQIANLVTEVYHGAEVGKQPGFNAFIKYLGEQDHEAAAAYWQGTLADCQAISFPALPPAVQQPVADATTAFQCPALARRPSDITMSTLIRAAWALLASSYTSSDDVVFGATVTGRNAPVAGIEAMAGPTIATVPVRVRVQHSHKVSEFLHSVQQQATEMIPYEQTGLHETAKVSADARHACSFQTLLIVQPGSNGDIAHDALGEWRSHSDLQDFTTYALMVQCVLADDEVQIIASFDRRAIEPWQVDKMLRQFSFVMQQLATADAEAGIASIDTLTPRTGSSFGSGTTTPGQGTTRRAGDLRLGRRHDLWRAGCAVGQAGGHLVELGVGPEDIVPLCFEKSMWTVVAMLAVLKAGGAFLLLDPSLPHERLRLMCRKVSAKLSLASEASAPLAKDLVGTVVIVNADSALQLAHHASPITSVRPTHTAPFNPKSVPSLSILCVGGEPIRASQIVRWGSQVHLRQTYGSSEVSGIVSSAALTTCSTMRDVGRASTGVFWIVDQTITTDLLQSELWTASTFIEAPAWRASLGLSAGQQRLYKTGDLARYKDDGSIELIGRKDNQVKLRGQRIEVEEIEHQARLAEADVAEIAVELIQPKDGEDGMLACFIVVEDSASNEDELSGKRTRLDTRTQRTIGKIQDRLERFFRSTWCLRCSFRY